MIIKNILIMIFLLLMPLPLLALDAPQLVSRVNDYAQMLSPEAKSTLEQKLAGFERDQSTQIAILTISSLQDDNIDQFAIRVADKWKIGQKGKDNGVILIIARAERKVRIEVGMGLQGVLPDITTAQIIRNTMRPYLKDEKYDQGITAGIDAIISATKGEFKPTATDTKKPAQNKPMSLLAQLLLLAGGMLVIGAFSRQLSAAAGAIGLPVITSFALPGLGFFSIALLAIAGLAVGLLLGAIAAGLFGGGGGGGGGGGFYGGGGFFGGGSSGGSSGSDGFSGGGGGFDGGGSSDDY